MTESHTSSDLRQRRLDRFNANRASRGLPPADRVRTRAPRRVGGDLPGLDGPQEARRGSAGHPAPGRAGGRTGEEAGSRGPEVGCGGAGQGRGVGRAMCGHVIPNQTRAEQLAYSRGYTNAASKRWPTGWPPAPAEPVIRKMLDSLRAIRGHADTLRSQICEDDEWVVELNRMIADADLAAQAVTDWLTSPTYAMERREGGG